MNPHSYGQYLSLLGHHQGSSYHRWGFPDDDPIGLGAGAAARGGRKKTKKGLVHQYRVRCGVELPSGPAPTFPGFEEGGREEEEEEERERGRGRIVAGGRRGCLETCEREAIARAETGSLSECLGVAFRELGLDASGPGPGGRGECRFWYGDGREHEFLPVHELPSAKGEGDRWQVLYM